MSNVPEGASLVPLSSDLLARRGAQLEQLRDGSASDLSEMYLGAYAELAKLARQAEQHTETMRLIERVWADRMHEREQTQLLTGDDRLSVGITPGARTDVRNNALLKERLEALRIDGESLPQAAIDKVVYPEKPKPPVLKSDLRELAKLIKAHGKPVQDIRDACIEDRYGPSTLTVSIGEGP